MVVHNLSLQKMEINHLSNLKYAKLGYGIFQRLDLGLKMLESLILSILLIMKIIIKK